VSTPAGTNTEHQRARSARAGRLLIVAALAVGLAACGAAEDPDPDQPTTNIDDRGPRVADQRFDGLFLITEAVVGGEPIPLEAVASINFETEFGGLVVEPGCNRYFGSFSLAEDGNASFTVAGGSQNSCDGLEQQDRGVLTALGRVTEWTELGDGFRFDGPSGDSITVGR
jgi:heat shock protein HslJ